MENTEKAGASAWRKQVRPSVSQSVAQSIPLPFVFHVEQWLAVPPGPPDRQVAPVGRVALVPLVQSVAFVQHVKQG